MTIKTFLSESSVLICTQILSVLGSLLLVKVLTIYLSPSEFGAFGLAMSVAAVFNGVLMPAFLAATSRYYSVAKENGELSEFLRCVEELIRYLFVFLICILLASFFFLYINGFQKWIYLDLFIWIFSLTNGIAVIYAGIQNSARNRIQFSALYALDSWLRIACCFLVFNLFSINATSAGLGYAISSSILLSIQFILFKEFFRFKIKRVMLQKKWVSKLVKYGFPFIVTGFFFWVQINSGRWFLEVFSTRESIGYFVVLTQLGFSSIQIVVTLILNIINPIFIYKGTNARTFEEFKNVKGVVFGISIAGAIITGLILLVSFIFKKIIFSLAVGIGYQSVSYLLPWVILAGGLYGISQVISSIPIYFEKSNKLISPIIFSSILGTIATAILTPYLGLDGVIISLCIFSGAHISINFVRILNLTK